MFDRLFADLPPATGALDRGRWAFLDSTTVRARLHAARAPKKPAGRRGVVPRRSRGGLSTEIHLAYTDERPAVAVVLTAGQASDAPALNQL